MCADLWNALLSMCEDIRRRKTQHGGWVFAADGPRVPGAEPANRTGLPSEYDMGYWISDMLAQCPEWRSLSTWTPRRVATSLSMAFKAFFRRAREGHGAASGYPRYKARRRAASVPHRSVSGCMMRKSDRHARSWTLRLKGVPGEIWARGMLPNNLSEWMDLDVMQRDGHWEASAAVAIEPRRIGGNGVVTVRLDLIEHFAEVDGAPDTPPDLLRAQQMQDHLDQMRSAADLKWPRRKQRYSDEEWSERCSDFAEIGHLAARIARIRRNALHVWSHGIVSRASDLTIVAPPVREVTRSPRGDKKEWGAAVATISHLNRRILSYAPAMAVKMLEYKAKEAGIRCDVMVASDTEVGGKLVASVKSVRKMKQRIKKANE